MEKKELIAHCRYYKGETKNPHTGDKAIFWDYEKLFIDEMAKPAESVFLSNLALEYSRAGLLEWNETDGTPFLLKALLFNRYEHWMQGGDFKEWYLSEYLGNN